MQRPETFQRVPVYSADEQELAPAGQGSSDDATRPTALVCTSRGRTNWGQTVADILPALLTEVGMQVRLLSLTSIQPEASESIISLPRRLARLYHIWRDLVSQSDTVVFAPGGRGMALPFMALAALTRFFGKRPLLICDANLSDCRSRRWLLKRLTDTVHVRPTETEIAPETAPDMSVLPVAAPVDDVRPDSRTCVPLLWSPQVIDSREAMITLFRAMKLITQKFPRARLTGVVASELHNEAESLITAERLTGIELNRQLDERTVRQLMRTADIAVCSDSTDINSPAILLAALSGQPVIVLSESLNEYAEPDSSPLQARLGDHAALSDLVCTLVDSGHEFKTAVARCCAWAAPCRMPDVAANWHAALTRRR